MSMPEFICYKYGCDGISYCLCRTYEHTQINECTERPQAQSSIFLFSTIAICFLPVTFFNYI